MKVLSKHTLLTSFDINSLWHKMPFSQRCHVSSYLMWPCRWCQTRRCNAPRLGHHRRLPMPRSQNEYEPLCLCSRPPDRRRIGFLTLSAMSVQITEYLADVKQPSQWPLPHCTDTDIQVTAPTWRAIITARQAICCWGEEADNSGPCLSYNKQTPPTPSHP